MTKWKLFGSDHGLIKVLPWRLEIMRGGKKNNKRKKKKIKSTANAEAEI
jgi:hypothetical protein